MKKFNIKSSLAYGLSDRISTMDCDTVIQTLGEDSIVSIRKSQAICEKINVANKEFKDIVDAIGARKDAVAREIQAKFAEDSKNLSPEEKAALGSKLTQELVAKTNEIQKESTANPETIITVEVSDEDYDHVLMPLFKKTANTWHVNQETNGQKLFLEVADALEAANDCQESVENVEKVETIEVPIERGDN